LAGKLVLPGLIDTHSHPIDGAFDGAKCSLADVAVEPPTLEALKPVIQKCLDKEPGGADDWFEAVQLYNYGFKATAQDLDSIEKTRPIGARRQRRHTAWVNSRGLALLCKTVKTLNLRTARSPRCVDGRPRRGDVNLVEDKNPKLLLESRHRSQPLS
jgi:predicted amidohydrolase YtcJ